MYDPITSDTDLHRVQRENRRARIIERAEREERRQHATISLRAQIDAAEIDRACRRAQRHEWIAAGLWSLAALSSIGVLTALVLWGAW